jgi:hypothetical protein
MNLGVTRIEATQTTPILDDFRAGRRVGRRVGRRRSRPTRPRTDVMTTAAPILR